MLRVIPNEGVFHAPVFGPLPAVPRGDWSRPRSVPAGDMIVAIFFFVLIPPTIATRNYHHLFLACHDALLAGRARRLRWP
jgi:hypothetical protein